MRDDVIVIDCMIRAMSLKKRGGAADINLCTIRNEVKRETKTTVASQQAGDKYKTLKTEY